jgi:DNA-binding NarL/FixJ family response regulator
VQARENEATPATLSLLTELVQGFRRPAIFGTERGALLCMNAAAVRKIAHEPSVTDQSIPADWPRRLTLQVDGQTFHLVAPDPSEGAASLPRLPPRLTKIAKMVIAGSTDKQIASRTGLSFSTVRTYVRQIYRRFGVHSRVELVHAMCD